MSKSKTEPTKEQAIRYADRLYRLPESQRANSIAQAKRRSGGTGSVSARDQVWATLG